MLRALTKIVRSGCNPRSLAPNIPNQVRALCDIPGPPKDPLKELQKLMEDVAVELKDAKIQLKGATGRERELLLEWINGLQQKENGLQQKENGLQQKENILLEQGIATKGAPLCHCWSSCAHTP
jgi:hypothetical protein